jgi:hypothetical protein
MTEAFGEAEVAASRMRDTTTSMSRIGSVISHRPEDWSGTLRTERGIRLINPNTARATPTHSGERNP